MILFGHQTGNPNAHHAALAHYESGRLDAFVVPWFPSRTALSLLRMLPVTRTMAARLERRRFEPLAMAIKNQGRLGEFRRLAIRAADMGDEGLSYEVNDWLMRTMAQACRRSSVTAIHSYEDACLWSFQEAKRLGKACIYDMPIGFYAAWKQTQAELVRRYADWLPAGGLPSSQFVRPEQKRREMELADLVMVPSKFVEDTIRKFHPDKVLARAAYGVDLAYWQPRVAPRAPGRLRFVYAGQLSIRKGIPLLLDAWHRAGVRDAELQLVGSWQLSEDKLRQLPKDVSYIGHVPPARLRDLFQQADVLVAPSFFEGLSLTVLETMACGVPVISSDATGLADVIDDSFGRVFPAGTADHLVEHLRFFATHTESLADMRKFARARAEEFTWERYRQALSTAVAPFC